MTTTVLCETPKVDRSFPIQGKTTHRTIPWWLAEEAYAVYSGDYGTNQTLDQLAQRGGFSAGEMDMFLPGWRDRIDKVKVLESRCASLSAEVERLRAGLNEIQYTPSYSTNSTDSAFLDAINRVRKLLLTPPPKAEPA